MVDRTIFARLDTRRDLLLKLLKTGGGFLQQPPGAASLLREFIPSTC